MPTVNPTQIAQYETDGYIVCEQLLCEAEVAELRHRMSEIATGSVPTFPLDAIEFEPGAEGVRNESTVRKINRGAEQDSIFMSYAKNSRILDVVESMIGPDIKLYGSQCFMKPPGGIEKPYHQDSAYFYIEPQTLVTCWAALDDATVENGCLCVIPGSHLGTILDHDQVWQVGERADMQVRDEQIDFACEVAIELKVGSCSFHHSKLLHRSGRNGTQQPRRGLAIHYMSAKSRWTHPTKPKPTYELLRGKEHEGCV